MPSPAAAGMPAARLRPAVPPPAQRVFMVSDSVGLGAKNQMINAFPGWQVTVTGKPGIFVEQLATNYVQYQPQNLFGDHAIVAGGYNYPYWDPPRFDRAIDQMVNTLKAKGVKHIYWITMREVTPALFSGWNSLSGAYKTLYLAYPGANNQLRNAQLRHPELSIIDWAAVAEQTGLTYDAIHLNPTGAARYSTLAANTVKTGATRVAAGSVTEVTVAGNFGVPADATAVALNLTVVNPRRYGWLTAFPCGAEMPVVSNLNFRPNQVVASSAVVPIGVDGKVCIYTNTEAHVVADVSGAFGPASGFLPLAPARAIDTRSTGMLAANTPTTVHLDEVPGVPDGPFVAVVNLTVLGNTSNADVTLYTCGTTPPTVPSRSVRAGFVQSLLMVVDTDATGDICVVVTKSAHVLVDVFGAFPADADIHPFTSRRVRDTRSEAMPGAGALLDLQVSGSPDVPTDPLPTAANVTLTLTSPQNIGYATAFPCVSGLPNTSMVNVVPNQQQTNAGLVPIDAAGRLCVYLSTASHVLVDLNGWTGTAFTPLTPARALDTRTA